MYIYISRQGAGQRGRAISAEEEPASLGVALQGRPSFGKTNNAAFPRITVATSSRRSAPTARGAVVRYYIIVVISIIIIIIISIIMINIISIIIIIITSNMFIVFIVLVLPYCHY